MIVAFLEYMQICILYVSERSSHARIQPLDIVAARYPAFPASHGDVGEIENPESEATDGRPTQALYSCLEFAT
jgi:hypothetical protein